MAATLKSQAIDIANRLISAAQTLASVKDQIDLANAQWTALTLKGVLDAFPTAAMNADGGMGASDTNPVAGHPIDVTAAGTGNLSRSISANDLTALSTLLGAVSKLLAGEAVTQQGQSPGLLAKLVGG